MLLSRCNLMPHGMLPLFIFEPRYRELLQHVLQMDRMFCVGFLAGEEESDEGIDSFSTAGLVRACVGHEDGTAHLVLQGVKRVRLKSWTQREPFRLAEVVPLQTSVKDDAEVVELSALLMERAAEVLRRGGAAEMAERVGSIEDPEVLADFVAANFLGDASLRQPLLGMSVLDERLRYLLEVFQGEV
ncbi:MAG: LON peptidase substrate-binding domain-containing protein [Verrucomicrobiota bacterium]|jgi:Lon protease-like protein